MAEFASQFVARASSNEALEDTQKLQQLQARVDDLLAGTPRRPAGTSAHEESRLFAQFLPNDQQRASALAALCMKRADEAGGVRGLELAIDELYDRLGGRPIGMVQYAAKLFLTHYGPAREHLVIRSLEGRQPDAVLPSA